VGLEGGGGGAEKEQWDELDVTYCLRVFVNRVGIAAIADCRCLNSRFRDGLFLVVLAKLATLAGSVSG